MPPEASQNVAVDSKTSFWNSDGLDHGWLLGIGGDTSNKVTATQGAGVSQTTCCICTRLI